MIFEKGIFPLLEAGAQHASQGGPSQPFKDWLVLGAGGAPDQGPTGGEHQVKPVAAPLAGGEHFPLRPRPGGQRTSERPRQEDAGKKDKEPLLQIGAQRAPAQQQCPREANDQEEKNPPLAGQVVLPQQRTGEDAPASCLARSKGEAPKGVRPRSFRPPCISDTPSSRAAISSMPLVMAYQRRRFFHHMTAAIGSNGRQKGPLNPHKTRIVQSPT